jgi:hypothetical protein
MSRPPATASARPLAAVPEPTPDRPPLRSALRAHGQPRRPASQPDRDPPAACWAPVAQPSPRQLMTDEFVLHLRSHTNRHGIHYSDGTLHAYRAAVTALDTWMTREAVDGDFTACEAGMLNRFFADYLREHTQGGVNTKQRNLRHFFTWLEKEYGHRHPYKDAELNRYRAPESTVRGS